ncbi:CPBP family intramembrane glutamic endopeptidase [Cryobacterium algoritolerans]|nr:CPBP family intramembrane glutamic endopeptidase [Cryobacterium algoritolerans]
MSRSVSTHSRRPSSSLRAFAARRPVILFCAVAVGLTLMLQTLLLVEGLDLTPGKLAELVILFGFALLLTSWISGAPLARRLPAGLACWRFGLGRWLLVLLALPTLTVAVGLTTGTFRTSPDGWGAVTLDYLVILVLIALTASAWEETAWSGFVQSRLMADHGLLIGSLLTAVPFALIRLPLAFESSGLAGTSLTDAWISWAFVIGSAPLLRYLAGGLLVDTGGSILAVALLHASFIASGSLSIVPGGWQDALALVALTILVAAYRALRGRSLVRGTIPAPAGPRSRPAGDQRATA